MTALLRFGGVGCVRGDRLLFAALDLTVAAGECVWLRGPNGAGKSSLIRIAAGLLTPASGTVVRGGPVALIDESSALDPEQTLADGLAFWARVDQIPSAQIDAVINLLALGPLRAVPVAMLSTGQRKRAALARVVASNAALWLLDEPANGLDTASQARLLTAVAAHRQGGGAVVLASHLPLAIPDVRAIDLPGAAL